MLASFQSWPDRASRHAEAIDGERGPEGGGRGEALGPLGQLGPI
jgi:hypothetical protein